MLKMLPFILVVAGAGYSYHTVVINQKEAKISRLEANAVTLKENATRLEAAFDVEKLAREKAEKNLQTQLKAVTELSAKIMRCKQRWMTTYLFLNVMILQDLLVQSLD